MRGEIWDIFKIEDNARGVREVNIWSKGIASVKRRVRREPTKIMWTDAWIGRWDLVADQIYKNSYLWWAIPVINDVMNVFIDPASSSILEIPHRFDIWEFLKFED
jgi:hypothetical protein